MPSTPTPRLRVMQQARGENINAWGDPNLNNALQRLEEGQAKVLTLAITGDKVLSVQNYLEDEARSAVLVLIGAPSSAFKITIPAAEKPYVVDNRTGQNCSIGTAVGVAATVRAGIQSVVFCSGADTSVVDLTLDKIRTAVGPVNMGGQRLTNVAAATSDTDAINRSQVQNLTAAGVQRASEWASKLSVTVDGAEYSAKEYAVGATTPLGSAKAWSTSTTVVAEGQKGARGYAADASAFADASNSSAGNAATSASNAANSGSNAATSATDAAESATRATIQADRAKSYADGLNLPDLSATAATKFLRVNSGGTGYELATVENSLVRSARTANSQISLSDKTKLIDITSGTFTQTFAAASVLGDGWFCYIKNSGLGDITLTPNGSDTIDGLTSFIMYPGEVRLLQCDGVNIRSVIICAFYRIWTESGNFIKPPGYRWFRSIMFGGGGGGGQATGSSTISGPSGSPGQALVQLHHEEKFSATNSVTIGAGGAAGGISPAPTGGGQGGVTRLGDLRVSGGSGGNGNLSSARNQIGSGVTVEGVGSLDNPAVTSSDGLPGNIPGGAGQGNAGGAYRAAAGARGEVHLWGII